MILDFEESTLNNIKEFNERLSDIKNKYPNVTMAMIRKYLKDGFKVASIPDEVYSDLDKLSEIRMEAIETEKNIILAEAQKSGVKLSKDFFSNKNLTPFFEEKYYEKMPTLRVFEYLTFYSSDEIARMTIKPRENSEQENSDEER